jgi:hypothetical protein
MNSPLRYAHLPKTFLILAIFILLSNNCWSQIFILGGFNRNYIKQDYLAGNVEGVSNYHFGAAWSMRPVKNLSYLSIERQFLFLWKGYKQSVGTTDYEAELLYLSFPFIIKYSYRFVSLQTGISLDLLTFTSDVKYAESSKFNNFDSSLIIGFDLFEQKRLGFYARYCIGLTQILDYYSFDKLGNFTGEIQDIKNRNFLLGLKLRLSNHIFPHEK